MDPNKRSTLAPLPAAAHSSGKSASLAREAGACSVHEGFVWFTGDTKSLLMTDVASPPSRINPIFRVHCGDWAFLTTGEHMVGVRVSAIHVCTKGGHTGR